MNNHDKYTRAKEQLIISILITTTTIGVAPGYHKVLLLLSPNSSSITSGVLGFPGTNTPASSVQCPPGHSAEYCSGYIAGFHEAVRSHQ
jgi:hypothetical protein